jgi:hypothetical protein
MIESTVADHGHLPITSFIMALIKCSECKREVSTKAKICPGCGAPIKSRHGCGSTALLFLLIIGVVAAIYNSPTSDQTKIENPTPSEPSAPSPPPAHTGQRVTVANYPASTSEEVLDKAISYTAQNDVAALNKLLDSGLLIQLKDGVPIEIMDTKILSGKIKIRPRGSTTEYWTVVEAVRDE